MSCIVLDVVVVEILLNYNTTDSVAISHSGKSSRRTTLTNESFLYDRISFSRHDCQTFIVLTVVHSRVSLSPVALWQPAGAALCSERARLLVFHIFICTKPPLEPFVGLREHDTTLRMAGTPGTAGSAGGPAGGAAAGARSNTSTPGAASARPTASPASSSLLAARSAASGMGADSMRPLNVKDGEPLPKACKLMECRQS